MTANEKAHLTIGLVVGFIGGAMLMGFFWWLS